MKLRYSAIALLLLTSPLAAQEQPKYVPFTVDEQTFNAIQQFLGDVPSKWANPLIQLLGQKEQAAQREATTKAVEPNGNK